MKRNVLLSLAVVFLAGLCMALDSQTMWVCIGNVKAAFTTSQLGEMPLSDGTSLSVLGCDYNVTEVDSIVIDGNLVDDNTVTVTYDGDKANVVIAGNIAQYITATVDGAHVSIIQDGVSDETGEVTYNLSGSSDDGEFYMEGSYKATVELNGLTLTNPAGAPINIQNGKRIDVSVKKGTVNTLTDCSDGAQKGCFVNKGHTEFKGKGVLNVYANTAHGIWSKEYIEMKNCTINVLKAVKDGVNCNQYLLMESGELNISGVGDDGIQVSFKDDVDREAEDTGTITIVDGTINVAATATAAKAIKADWDVLIQGGTITASTAGTGEWDETDVKTKGATCISADNNVQIDGGTLSLTSTGNAGKGISCDNEFIMNDGSLTISTSGNMIVYYNGTLYDGNYTGNTDRIDSDYKSSPKGVKADGNVTINGGTINVTTTGTGGEGIESKAILTINDGDITCHTYDDAINSKGDLVVNGGKIFVVATNNDGLDANGNLFINGGTTVAYGSGGAEGGIDANDEDKYHLYITGGTVIGVGGRNSNPYSNSSLSIQPAIIYSGSLSQGSTLILNDGNGNNVLAFTMTQSITGGQGGPGGWFAPPGGHGGNMGGSVAMIISTPALTKGSKYSLYTGGSASGDDFNGLILNADVTNNGTSVGDVSSLASPYSTVSSSQGGGGRW